MYLPCQRRPLIHQTHVNSGTNCGGVPSHADEKPQKAKQRHPSEPPAENTPAVSAAQSSPSEPWAAVDLEQMVRNLRFCADNVARLAHRETDIFRRQELITKLLKLEAAFQGKQKQLKDHRMKEIREQLVKEGGADWVSPAADNTSLLAKNLERHLAVQEQSPPNKHIVKPQSARRELEDAFGHKIYGPDADRPSKPPASVRAEPSRPEAQEGPETEWTDVKLEDAEEPLGQEEWEDDIAPEAIPRGAAQNPQYPNLTL